MTKRDGLVLDIMGPERSGKTDFALSVSLIHPPTLLLALDYNYLGPFRRYQRLGAKIEAKEFFYSLPHPPPTSPKEQGFEQRVNEVANICRPVFKGFQEALWEGLNGSRFNSVIIDNGSNLYKLCRFSCFGYIHKVPRHLYAKSTNAMSTIINQVRYSGKNVVWIHRQVEKWVDDKPSGEFERAGAFKEIAYEVMASLSASRDEESGKFQVEILDSMFNVDSIGRGFRGSKRTFQRVSEVLREEPNAGGSA